MKSLAIYHKLIMSNGLIPTIICMIFCIFYPDTAVLYAASLGSIIYILYRLVKPPLHQPNLVLLNGTLALISVSVIKGIGGEWLIPDNTTNMTLEILILSFSLLYFITPNSYKNFFSYFGYKISPVNNWAILIIAPLSGLHLVIFCVIYLFFHPLSPTTVYIMEQIIPPLLYIACIPINYFLVKFINQSYKKVPCVRIAPVCNGKIYVVPLEYYEEEAGKMDLPLEGYIFAKHVHVDVNSYAKKIEADYSKYITGDPEPRFSLKYLANVKGGKKLVLLYILPLDDEAQLHFTKGKFVTPEEIETHPEQYSSLLNEEVNHLNVVVQMWKEYK